ncbi:hypothetical protein B0H13DRAFT_2332219 [Mycena leptocephala]|nr:hypothetical protein B0H13DRAFT_2332219 [Mycena leptocephala]
MVSTAKELAVNPELSLSLDEWFQAWGCLLELIETYISEEHQMWLAHFNSMLYRPNRAQNWSICLNTNENYHKSRNCSAGPGTPRRDQNGVLYWYTFKGFSGFTRGADCDKGKHWCSICGVKNIVTPPLLDKWDAALNAANIHHLFNDIPIGLRESFHMGIHSTIVETYTPPNHTSALTHPTVIQDYINKGRAGGQYTGLFSRS